MSTVAVAVRRQMATAVDVAPTPAAPAVVRQQLLRFLDRSKRLCVLTGAGVSTDSGIPDYRDANGAWKHRAPITFQAFVDEPAMRQRYWARSFIGWPRVQAARPNPVHHALVVLERQGRLDTVITQNVDGLHSLAGQRAVIDLHGRLDAVVCLQCGARGSRAELQTRLTAQHPERGVLPALMKPDGDVALDDAEIDGFRVPLCNGCGGVLKPDVVFFGENIPAARAIAAQQAVADADALLVLGSSLMVYSGFRLARLATERGKSLALLNRGVTRADALATHKWHADCRSLADAVL